MHDFSHLQIYNDKNVAASKLVEVMKMVGFDLSHPPAVGLMILTETF